MAQPTSETQISAHHVHEAVDYVSGDPETTAFKRRARQHQSLWREANGLPIGAQPMRPTPDRPQRPLGSRLPLDFARTTGANFLTTAARAAADDRVARPQPRQTLDADRLYADLLSSMPMCFNLFGPLQSDLALADRAVHAWWPNVPGRVIGVEFEWSPGRQLAGEYLENRSAFDVAFMLELDDGGLGVLGVETKYHEHAKVEAPPSDVRLACYLEVNNRAALMAGADIDALVGTELQQIWQDHLLAASMVQHASGRWAWAGFALVHPRGNPSFARAAEKYRRLLRDPTALQVSTLEDLLGADVLPTDLAAALATRYLPSELA